MMARKCAPVATPAAAENISSGIAPCSDGPDHRWRITTLIALNSMARRRARPFGRTTISSAATSVWWVRSACSTLPTLDEFGPACPPLASSVAKAAALGAPMDK